MRNRLSFSLPGFCFCSSPSLAFCCLCLLGFFVRPLALSSKWFPWRSLALPFFPQLSLAFLSLLLFYLVVKHLGIYRASRSLAKTGFFLAIPNNFFVSFFDVVVYRFSVHFGGVLAANMAPKIDFWNHFFDVFLGPSFLDVFC